MLKQINLGIQNISTEEHVAFWLYECSHRVFVILILMICISWNMLFLTTGLLF